MAKTSICSVCRGTLKVKDDVFPRYHDCVICEGKGRLCCEIWPIGKCLNCDNVKPDPTLPQLVP